MSDKVKEHLNNILFKTIENCTSVKFYVLVTTTIFFYIGKLSENVWQETILVVAGLRAVNEVASMFKKEPTQSKAVAASPSAEEKE